MTDEEIEAGVGWHCPRLHSMGGEGPASSHPMPTNLSGQSVKRGSTMDSAERILSLCSGPPRLYGPPSSWVFSGLRVRQCTEFTPFPGPHLHRGCHSQILSWGLNLVLTSKLPTFEVLRFRLALRSRKQSVRIGGCLRAIRDSHFNKIVEFHHPKFHRKSASIQEDLIRTTLTSLECALIIYQGPRLNHLPKGQMGALPSSNYVFLAKVLNHCLPFLLCKMSDSKNSVNQIQVLPLETSLAHDGC